MNAVGIEVAVALKRPIEPRGLSREEAAAYCGLTPDSFDHWRRQKKLPGPMPGTRRWDRKAIDRALDLLSSLPSESESASALETWRRQREAS